MKARIKAIYESEEDASFFKVLLKDADLKSVLNSQEYKSRINMYDYELYNSLEATTKQIQAYEQELGEKQDSLTKDKDSYEQQMSELDTMLPILIFRISSHRLMPRTARWHRFWRKRRRLPRPRLSMKRL